MKRPLRCNYAIVFTKLDVRKLMGTELGDLREAKELLPMKGFTTKAEATGRKKAKDVVNGEQEVILEAVSDANGV